MTTQNMGKKFGTVNRGARQVPRVPNQKRVNSALHALKAFARYTGNDTGYCTRDLLANMMHLCHQRPDDFGHFANELRIATDHFNAEKVEVQS